MAAEATVPTSKDAPELLDRHTEMCNPIEVLLPLMDGALHFTPPAICESSGPEEKLNKYGRQFADLVHLICLDGLRAATDAVLDTPGQYKAFIEEADKVRSKMETATAIAGVLANDELPADLNAWRLLERIQDGIQSAMDVLEARPMLRSLKVGEGQS